MYNSYPFANLEKVRLWGFQCLCVVFPGAPGMVNVGGSRGRRGACGIWFLQSILYKYLWLFIISRFLHWDDKRELRSPSIIQGFDILVAFLIEMCWPISSLLHLTWGVWDPLMFNHINVPNSLSATQIPSPRYPLVDDFSREHLPNLTKGRNPMESFLYLSIKLVIHMDCIRVDISHLHQWTYRFTKQREKKKDG